MFRPPSLLATQVAPTDTTLPYGRRGVYFRTSVSSLPPSPSDMLTVRIGQLTVGDFHPIRLTALSAVPMAKRVSPFVIQQALTRKMDDYVFTRTTLESVLRKQGKEQTISGEHLTRLSESLACGISRETMRYYLEQAPPSVTLGHIAMTMEVEASLEQNKFDPKMARTIAVTGLKENYFASETRDFARVLVAAKRKGIPDQKIAEAGLKAIQKKEPVMSMASQLGVKAEDISHGPSVGSGKGHSERGTDLGGHRKGGHGGGGSDRGDSGKGEHGDGDSDGRDSGKGEHGDGDQD